MFLILLSALNSILVFLLRQVVIKAVVFIAVYLLVTELATAVSSYLPKSFNIQQLFNSLPDGVIYFLNLFQFAPGLTLLISAWMTRFFIRRIPLIG